MNKETMELEQEIARLKTELENRDQYVEKIIKEWKDTIETAKNWKSEYEITKKLLDETMEMNIKLSEELQDDGNSIKRLSKKLIENSVIIQYIRTYLLR